MCVSYMFLHGSPCVNTLNLFVSFFIVWLPKEFIPCDSEKLLFKWIWKKGKLFCHSKLFLVFGYFKQFQSTECITLKMCVVWSFRLVGFFAFSINRSKNRWNAVNWVWLRFFVLYLLSYKKNLLTVYHSNYGHHVAGSSLGWMLERSK